MTKQQRPVEGPGVWASTLLDLRGSGSEPYFGRTGLGLVTSLEGGMHGLKEGDRMVWFGRQVREELFVPDLMMSAVPGDLPDEVAVWAGLAAMTLQAIRQSGLTFGEDAFVCGVGPIPDLVSQMLQQYGCYVYGETETEPGTCDGIFLCGGLLDNSTLQLLRRGGHLVVLDDQPGPSVLPGRGIQTVSPSYPTCGPTEYYDPPSYMRWTMKRDLELCLDLFQAGGLQVPVRVDLEAKS